MEHDGVRVIYLDGHNNPGLSGAPVVYRNLNERLTVFKVLAVVSGYESDLTPVLEPEEIKREAIKATDVARGRIVEQDGKIFRLKDTGHRVQANTGIVKAYDVRHAVDLIRKNPVGPKIAD